MFSHPQPHEVEPSSEISGFQVLLNSHGYLSVSAHVNGGRFAQFALRVRELWVCPAGQMLICGCGGGRGWRVEEAGDFTIWLREALRPP